MAGLDSTKAAVDAGIELVRQARQQVADGLSVDDIAAGMADGPTKDAFVSLVDAAAGMPGEMGDLSPLEALELGQHLLGTLRDL